MLDIWPIRPPPSGEKPGPTNFLFFLTIFDEIFEWANESRCGAGTESESETICWLVICDTLVSYIDIQAPFGLSSSYHKTLNSVRVIFSDSFESLLFSYNFFIIFQFSTPKGWRMGYGWVSGCCLEQWTVYWYAEGEVQAPPAGRAREDGAPE